MRFMNKWWLGIEQYSSEYMRGNGSREEKLELKAIYRASDWEVFGTVNSREYTTYFRLEHQATKQPSNQSLTSVFVISCQSVDSIPL
jgi:hypothetical protein